MLALPPNYQFAAKRFHIHKLEIANTVKMAVAQIFLSHGKRDEAVVNALHSAFAGTNVRPVLMEYEAYTNPPFQKIKSEIHQSSALFVLLGQSLTASPYTQNWVSYETGVADNAGKIIWVLEDIRNQIIFPLPKVDHYVTYDPTSQQSLQYLRKIIQSYSFNTDGAVAGGLLMLIATSHPILALLGALIGSQYNVPETPVGMRVQCPWQNCGILFSFHNMASTILCPSCRQPIGLNMTR